MPRIGKRVEPTEAGGKRRREIPRVLDRDDRILRDVDQSAAGLRVRGYPAWERLGHAPAARYAAALQALSVDLAMARDPVVADVVHAHTWYVAFAGVLVRALFDLPLVVTLHSIEPLRPWKQDQLGAGYTLSSWVERTAVEQAERVIAVSHEMRADVLQHFRVPPERVVAIPNGIDAEAFRKLVEWQIDQGTHGLVPCGTTGECAALLWEEKQRFVDTAGRVERFQRKYNRKAIEQG